MAYWVYMIQSKTDGCRYVGSSEEPHQRLQAHNQGRSRYTKGHRPWVLIYTESYSTRAEAVHRERVLKSGVGRRWLDQELKRTGEGQIIAR